MTNLASFEAEVAKQVQRLKSRPLAEIERHVAAKRKAWCEGNRDRIAARIIDRPVRPRAAFEVLFFDYMGLSAKDLPILIENEAEIVWSSRNPCPTLEACRQLQLDTRVVCRQAYEKSTQTFLSAIDPELRFLRDYRKIRPHAEACIERIVRVDFSALMRIAIAEARQSRHDGNKGYGAAVVMGSQLLAQAHDTAVTERDPSLHAEVNAIRIAARALGQSDLSGAIMVSTCEPCPMCAALAVWANITTIVFGASIAETAARGKVRILLPSADVIAKGPGMIDIVPGVLADECLGLYS